jgi:argininosuccinate lyase
MRLWGGRFSKDPNELALQFTQSLPFDQRLAECDIEGSIAHARMLGKCRIITRGEALKLEAGLERIRAGLASGEITLDPHSEDIHTEIERLLFEQVGPLAGKLHTARSRNDQVALDMRLYLREEIDQIQQEIRDLQQVLVDLAERHLGAPMPGYTHTQLAQPVLLSHHLLAYFWMLQRDRDRLAEGRARVNLCPLGAAALAGTSFPIDPAFVAKQLGFDGLCPNSMDAVADRDFLVEFLADAALTMAHLSRLANEIVLMSTVELGFLRLDDAWCTGSSIMPQKRNPDPAELVRGKSGRAYGNLLAVLTVLKGLPLTYNRDLQEDKEALFDTLDTLRPCLNVMREMLATATFDTERMAAAAGRGFSTATEVADYLVRKGLAFREAHGIVGQIVRYCEKQGVAFGDLALTEWRSFSKEFGEEILEIISPLGAIEAKRSPGGTAPERVKEQIEKARKLLAE